MISTAMQDALNTQINNELYSAYFYLGMSARCSDMGLNGCAHWFRLQYQEETMHAMKIYDYLLEQGATVTFNAIAKPPVEFDSVRDMFTATLEHERGVTQNFYDLTDLAEKERDHATRIYLQWFITEQIEEEASVQGVIDQLKLVGTEGSGLFMIDAQLGRRQDAADQTDNA